MNQDLFVVLGTQTMEASVVTEPICYFNSMEAAREKARQLGVETIEFAKRLKQWRKGLRDFEDEFGVEPLRTIQFADTQYELNLMCAELKAVEMFREEFEFIFKSWLTSNPPPVFAFENCSFSIHAIETGV